jgi:uncharacterized protein YyaL (SSP411 family)
VGGGIHRYSTDERWLLPHFEKMLYDQANALIAYSTAYQMTGDDLMKATALEICEYVHERLTHPQGAFFSAEDADSEGEEGKYYVWPWAELKALLDERSDARVSRVQLP